MLKQHLYLENTVFLHNIAEKCLPENFVCYYETNQDTNCSKLIQLMKILTPNHNVQSRATAQIKEPN
jgi:hypothetical protein